LISYTMSLDSGKTMTPATEELLTVDEVAVLLRTTPNAVRHMIARAQLPGVVRLGRRVLVRRDDVRKYVGLTS
jgi:excisionase family DNA binding protein